MVVLGSEEEEIARIEEEIKKLDNIDYGSPTPEKKEGIFRFFREILFLKDTTRIGNLLNTELGQARLGVRHYLELGAYAEVEGLDTVAKYLRGKAEIITSTSMSRKGFWAKLFVTNIKREQKEAPKEQKKGWFSKKTPEGETAE